MIPRSPRSSRRDAAGLREVLVRAIAENHPAHPGEIDIEQYQHCRHFLSHFHTIYTVNYDLLLYWAIMQDLEPEVPSDDGFRRPEDREEEYCSLGTGRSSAVDPLPTRCASRIRMPRRRCKSIRG